VDGAHIRTLLLTFFFNQMTDLIRRGNLYIAQPPLFQVRKGKKSRYLSTEEEMEQFLFESVLESSKVTVDNGEGKRSAINLRALVRACNTALDKEKMVSRLRRVYGVTRESLRAALTLPKEKKLDPGSLTPEELREIFGEGAALINTHEAQQQFISESGDENENGKNAPAKLQVRLEGEIDLAFFLSHEFSALMAHFDAKPATATVKPPYRLENNEGEVTFETEDLLELREYLLTIAKKGLTIQRYKGLGEMNPEQLQETTMDPQKRTLLRVQLDDENMVTDIFETLMGDLVEPRKQFIEKHAPETKNLDI
jgi:DNA gyrase subunit B